MALKNIVRNKDTRWLAIWIGVTSFVWLWDTLFLNKPALHKVAAGFFNTVIIAGLVMLFTLALGWVVTLFLHGLQSQGKRGPYLLASFILNLIRSVPQIVGILLGYIIITILVNEEIVRSKLLVFILMALCISAFIFLELVDLMRDRIDHFTKLDFYSAMRVAGIPDRRIVNFDILWKNSRLHIFNKLIAVIGYAVFLQCSVDFVISAGLSEDANEVTLPTTLGSLLAKFGSKQDILAISNALTDFKNIGQLFFVNLQGLTVAFLIVFSLVSIYHIANGYAERHRL
jgi:hypothetical protein